VIPSRDECIELMERFGMLANIREHSVLVCRVALTIAELLNTNGNGLNLDLIEAGALLHDITKTRALKTGENHSQTGADLMEQLGFPEVAVVVAQHVNLAPREGGRSLLTEAEVVNYSDKRVMHDRIVTLDERFEDIKARYGATPEKILRIMETEKRARDLERKILSRLALSQRDLERLIYEKT
jgi:uncharacterized protein